LSFPAGQLVIRSGSVEIPCITEKENLSIRGTGTRCAACHAGHNLGDRRICGGHGEFVLTNTLVTSAQIVCER